jgi:DNA-binding PadR family transcriptional regulator
VGRYSAGTRIGPGTLYGALARLERRGLIEALPAEDRRRPYRLTGLGADLLRDQLTAVGAFAAAGLRRLGAT